VDLFLRHLWPVTDGESSVPLVSGRSRTRSPCRVVRRFDDELHPRDTTARTAGRFLWCNRLPHAWYTLTNATCGAPMDVDLVGSVAGFDLDVRWSSPMPWKWSPGSRSARPGTTDPPRHFAGATRRRSFLVGLRLRLDRDLDHRPEAIFCFQNQPAFRIYACRGAGLLSGLPSRQCRRRSFLMSRGCCLCISTCGRWLLAARSLMTPVPDKSVPE